jgi:pyruvate dehydrogenase E2 component (dihydrolipoamide acetyltransferase)
MPKFTRAKNLSPWRKLALSFWSKPADPSVYGWYEFDVTNAQNYLAKLNVSSPVKITLTHYFAKALGLVIAKYPMINGIVKMGTVYLRDSVDLFLQVAIHGDGKHAGDHLSGAKIDGIDKKSLVVIAQELVSKAMDIRDDRDPQFQQQFALTKLLPAFLLKWLVRLNEFAVYDLGLSAPALGMHADPFGSAMLTSVGALDVPPGLAPIVPPSRCPLLMCIGRVEKKPWVTENGTIEARPIMMFTITFDHRFMDGLTASKMFKLLLDILYHPETYFDATG